MPSDNFPDPFGDTLCVPHYMYFPVRLLWQCFVVAMMLKFLEKAKCYANILSERSDMITWQNCERMRLKRKGRTANRGGIHDQLHRSKFMNCRMDLISALKDSILSQLRQAETKVPFVATEESPKEAAKVKSIYDSAVSESTTEAGSGTAVMELTAISRVTVSKSVADNSLKLYDASLIHDKIVDIVTDNVNLDECAFQQMTREYNQQLTLKATAQRRFQAIGNAIVAFVAAVYLLSLAGCCAQFAKWYVANKNASVWRHYQAFAVALSHLPGLPLSHFIWCALFYSQFSTSKKRSGTLSAEQLLTGRLTFCVIVSFPFIFTHWLPSYFAFGPLVCVPIFITFVIFFFADNLKMPTKHDEKMLLLLVFVFEMTLQMTFIALVQLYSGSDWLNAFKSSLYGTYCADTESWIVFKVADFTWREWSVAFAWLF